MKNMNVSVVTAMTCLAAVSCHTISTNKGGQINRENAVAAAKKELDRRHLRLPAAYTVTVEKGVIDGEPTVIPIYQVSFRPRSNRQADVLYGVSVDRHTGAIEDFFDTRDYRPADMSLEEFLKRRRKKQE
jgi:hypothetical protein